MSRARIRVASSSRVSPSPARAGKSELVAAVEHRPLGVVVVRRCVDLADLLATAASGTARAVLLSADLRRLDRDALARLETARVAVIAPGQPGDEAAERRLRQLGCRHVLPADSPPGRVSAEVRDAVTELARPWLHGAHRATASSYADPRSALPYVTGATTPTCRPTGSASASSLPCGARRAHPGRTTVAVTMAAEAARMGIDTLLADADTYGGCVAQLLGLLDEAPGIASRRGRRTLARSTIKRSLAWPARSSRNCASCPG